MKYLVSYNTVEIVILYQQFCNLFTCNLSFAKCINIYRRSCKRNDGRLTTAAFSSLITRDLGYNVILTDVKATWFFAVQYSLATYYQPRIYVV